MYYFLYGTFLFGAVNFVHHIDRSFTNLKPIRIGYALIALDGFRSIH
ncbi:hypothetical protein [uncultured Acinetobacter sp.]|nr:hypothetical protein [uncultured Acinetobacter sp.]